MSKGSTKAGCGGCLILLAGQVIIFPAAYYGGVGIYHLLTRMAWIKDDEANGLIAVFAGMFICFALNFLLDTFVKRVTGTSALDTASSLSPLGEIFRIFDIFN